MSEKTLRITSVNSLVQASDDDSSMTLAHGMIVGRIQDLTDEQRTIVVELMKGYSDFVEEDTE